MMHWEFLEEVLILKEFSGKWIEWVKQVVEGGGGGSASMSIMSRGNSSGLLKA
jgi:hypothetical protein